MLRACNHVGLLSASFDQTCGELWGGFPHTGAMVGLVNAAMVLSKPWREGF